MYYNTIIGSCSSKWDQLDHWNSLHQSYKEDVGSNQTQGLYHYFSSKKRSEEGWRVQRLKCCDYTNNQDKETGLSSSAYNNDTLSSKKFGQKRTHNNVIILVVTMFRL